MKRNKSDIILKKNTAMLCIMVEYGLRKEIMEHLGISYPTVKKELAYQSNTELAEKIRHYALTHGGVLAVKHSLE